MSMDSNLPATQTDAVAIETDERPALPRRQPVSVAFLPLALVTFIILAFAIAMWIFLAAGIFMIPIAIAARFLSVGAPIVLLRRALALPRHAVKVLVGTGLRGGISVALALSLPAGAERDLLVTVTYVVVAFSIIVQGLAVEPFLRRLDLGSS